MNLAYDLFLLTFNLSQLHDREKIIKLFIEGLQEIFKPAVFAFNVNPIADSTESFEVKSRQNHYGYISFQSQALLIKEHIVLICNAIQMVAVIIDNLDYGTSLKLEKERLQKYADLKLEELKNTVKDLEDARTASINLNEDLTDAIEQRRMAEEIIRDSEQKFRDLYENMAEGVALHKIDFDSDGSPVNYRIIDVNPKYEKILGFKKNDIIGRKATEVYNVENAPYLEEYFNVVKTGKQYEFESYFAPLKKYFSISVSQWSKDGFATIFSDITNRKNTEDNLRNTQLILKATLESPVEMIILAIDMGYNYLSFNSAHKAVMKAAYGSDIGPGLNLLECMAGEEDIKNAKENYGRAMKGESLITIQEYGEIDRSYYETFYNPIRNENNEIVGATAFARNITERKMAELALKESEEKFRNLFEHSPVGKSMTGIDGSIIVNKTFCNILGYSEDELRSKNWKGISHPDDIPRTDDIIKSLISGKSDSARFESRYIHKNGSTIYTDVSTYLQRDNEGKPQFFITTISDITEQKESQLEILKRESLLNKVFEVLPIGLWFADSNGKLLRGNPAGIEIWGAEPTVPIEEYGVFKARRLPSGVELSANDWALAHTITEGVTIKDELLEIDAFDGKTKVVLNYTAPVLDNDGNMLGAIVVNNEITDRVRAIEEIQKLNDELEKRVMERTAQLRTANKELEAFSYSVSHDLRAPLRAIHSFTSILREDYKDTLDDEGRRICDIIESSSVHMGNLIDDLLSFSRVGRTELKFSNIDMTKLAKKVYFESGDEKQKERIKLDIRKLPSANGDLSAIRQVFVNLISNAIKYTSKTEKPSILISYDKVDNEIVYFVKDNGVGFDMVYADKLFGVFQRLHSSKEFEGNGVGLAIVQRIIHRHGGKVWAEAEVGKGATFFFTLPAKE